MMNPLEHEFDSVMHSIYVRAKKECGYNATEFLNMLSRDRGITTAKRLINTPKQSPGYTNLYLLDRLDLTVEATVWENTKFWPLFTEDDIEAARKRLEENEYFKQNSSSTAGP